MPPLISLAVVTRRDSQPVGHRSCASSLPAAIPAGGNLMAAQSQALSPSEQSLVIRRATPADAEVCGRICFEAFSTLANRHNLPQDFPNPEVTIGILSMMFSHPGFFCVVAEQEGKVIGSNCLDERSPIAGVGPITIDPAAQNRTAGRQLMQVASDTEFFQRRRSKRRRGSGSRRSRSQHRRQRRNGTTCVKKSMSVVCASERFKKHQ